MSVTSEFGDVSAPHIISEQEKSYQAADSLPQHPFGNGNDSSHRRHHHSHSKHNVLHRQHGNALGSRELCDRDRELEEDDEEEEEDDEKETVLLYGMLDVNIYEARGLPNMDLFTESIAQCFGALNFCQKPFQKAKKKVRKHSKKRITSDPYVCVNVGGARLARSRVVSNSDDPVWNEHFLIHVGHFVSDVVFTIKDDDILGSQRIGRVKIPAKKISSGECIDGWFDVIGSGGKPCKQGASLRLSVTYTAVDDDPAYRKGCSGVSNVYFPQREGCEVVLYQDAHVLDGALPKIELDNGKTFVQRKCWEELCQAILEAHHMVYVVGWAVYDKIKLVRGETAGLPDGADLCLGDLLKRKASEGVRVLLLVWDDKTSHDTPFFKIKGVMGTHDEETKKFFKHSSVKCILSPRYGDRKLSWFRQQIVGTLYTHHQKLVIADSQGPGHTRKITAFLGGLDLCDGRYDTPDHSIFNTLSTVHKDDCYNATFSVKAQNGGPRQPWHDQHCKLEGPAAYDCLTNFEQRWRKSRRWHDDALVQLHNISWILGPIKQQNEESIKSLKVTKEDDAETWSAQIFRSIDSGSVRGFPKHVPEAEKQNLVCGKSIAIDRSIHIAYVERIRSAQHFIYIENQYFLGSSYAWPNYKNAGATHLIPMELALKISTKIRARERFAVYVVIPMWPEGAPDSVSGQEILFFQAQTMEMMYVMIAKALQETGLSKEFHLKDYLNFYCLGNREIKNEAPEIPPPEKSKQQRAQQSGRFLIYVHAKSMVVDDEYIILGSANINQRSMDGSRDTEIAMGAYQPHHTWAQKQGHPHGQIYGHRMSLWAEHFGQVKDCFGYPASVECVREVNRMAEENWKQYVSDDSTIELKGHLMPYPLKVNENGKLESLNGFDNFPDVGGKVLGSPYMNVPDALTT